MSDDSMALGYALGQDSNNGGGNDGMWGGNGSWIFAFLIIALIFGGNGWGNWGGNGGNGAGYQGAVTRSDLCSEFNFNNLSRSVRPAVTPLKPLFMLVFTPLISWAF